MHYISASCFTSLFLSREPPNCPETRSPFLEMLLNHHNLSKVFAFKVLLVSPQQLHSWQSPAVEPNLCKGGAWLRYIHCLWGGLLKISRYKGVFFALNWLLYHFSLTSIRKPQTSIEIDTLPRNAVLFLFSSFFFDILKWLSGLKRPFNIKRRAAVMGRGALSGKWYMLHTVGVWHITWRSSCFALIL